MLCLLGQPMAVVDGRRTPLALRPKAMALLAYLALKEGEGARHDLARLLFPRAEAPLADLRWHLNHLRSAAPAVITDGLRVTRHRIALAAPTDVAGLILLEGMIGDRAFVENAAAQAAPLAGSLDQRFGGFDEYLVKARAERARRSDAAERLLDRVVHYDLAPLPDGTYRRRALRSALEAEWASIIAADSLAMLARVACPILIVQALQPWLGGRPYFTDAIVEAQRRAAPRAQVFVVRRSTHETLVLDPEPDMIEAIRVIVRRCGQRRLTTVH